MSTYLCIEVDAYAPADEGQEEEDGSPDGRALPVQTLGDDIVDEQQDEVTQEDRQEVGPKVCWLEGQGKDGTTWGGEGKEGG